MNNLVPLSSIVWSIQSLWGVSLSVCMSICILLLQL